MPSCTPYWPARRMRRTPGMRSKLQLMASGTGRSGLGSSHCAVRWKRCMAAARSSMPGDDLDSGGATADDGHTSAREIYGVVPLSGVEHRPGELVQTRHVEPPWLMPRSGGQDQNPGAVLAVGGLHKPAPRVLVPPGLDDTDAAPQHLTDSVTVRGRAQVVVDLPLPGEDPAPPRVGGEGVGVQRGRNIAGAPRVGVLPPGSPELRRLLQHHKVTPALLAQPDRGTDAGEPGADHHRLHIPAPSRPGITCRLRQSPHGIDTRAALPGTLRQAQCGGNRKDAVRA